MDLKKLSKQELIEKIKNLKQERSSALEKILCSKKRLEKILNATPVGICVTDEHGFYEMVNPAYCRLYGYSKKELLGKNFTLVVPDKFKDHLRKLHDDFISGEIEIRGEWLVKTKAGEEKTILADAVKIEGEDGRPKKVTFIMDISEKISFENELKEKNVLLERLNKIDGLTGLFNHRFIYEKLDEEIKRSSRYDNPLTVIMMDIDHFKKINDTHGHLAGDKILKKIAETLQDSIRDVDFAGRYGGEEFLIIMPDSDIESAQFAAERIRKNIERQDFPEMINVTISGGVAQYNKGKSSDLIEAADRALYEAKSGGRNQIVTSK